MKILVVCQYYYPEPFRITDVCEGLVKRGHTVTVLTGLPNYPDGIVPQEYKHGKKRDEELNGVHVVRCFEPQRGSNPISRVINYFAFPVFAARKIKKLESDYDIVFVNQLSPVMMAYPAIKYKKRNNKKLFLYCLDLWPASIAAGGLSLDSPAYKLLLRMSQKIYHSADKIAVSSSDFKRYFDDVIGIDAKDIAFLPQYAEDIFEPTERIRSTEEKISFTFAGNIGDAQSVDTIIKAAAQLKDDSRICFNIIGDGVALEACKKLSAELDLHNVVFYGRLPLSEMPEHYAKTDAMLVTMIDDELLSYTLPGKVQSYMAAGKPVIAACKGETARVINEAQCGACCAAGDYVALSEAIRAFADGSDAVPMGKNSREYYLKHFSKEAFFNNAEDIMNALSQ